MNHAMKRVTLALAVAFSVVQTFPVCAQDKQASSADWRGRMPTRSECRPTFSPFHGAIFQSFGTPGSRRSRATLPRLTHR